MYLVFFFNITLLQFTSILNFCCPSAVHSARHYKVSGAEGLELGLEADGVVGNSKHLYQGNQRKILA